MRTLAEHRARLCLLSLEELQKSWDLENWVLHLFFKGLDDRTAESLGLVGSGTRITAEAQEPGSGAEGDGDGDGDGKEHGLGADHGGVSGAGACSAADPTTSGMLMPPPNPQDDWYGWVPWEDEADALNLQNLEFLYRFL
ncbi:uncharacterized protein BDV17DRAFT_292786 [Aspergillus undulatus]|uniref:uncharacterized protein n=1 Tax=Aspergillus undulatus TaxID=1810928 RepID=UPI003CCDB40B